MIKKELVSAYEISSFKFIKKFFEQANLLITQPTFFVYLRIKKGGCHILKSPLYWTCK